MDLINHKQITELVSLFSEFDEAEGLSQLYYSAQSSYFELIGYGLDLFESENKAAVLFLMHKLKNQFKNLGMEMACDELARLKARIDGATSSPQEDLALVENLKETAFCSFGYIFDNYLD